MPTSRQTILMCAPDHFGVHYNINPWMEHQIGKADSTLATRQWQNLCDALAAHADLVFVPPQPDVPDMVFTANAGLVLHDKVIVSRFRSVERQAEEPYFHAWFAKNNFNILPWPEAMPFEGAGDALFDRGRELLWVGSGFRSDPAAPQLIEQSIGRRTVALKLVDPRFYHLDTCLCPLDGGWLLYYPAAFDQASQAKILAEVPADKLIAVEEDDALHFSCNAVDLNRHVFINHASDDLQNQLLLAGFTPVVTPLSEFLKAGGGAKCLTLKLVEA